MAPGVHSRIYCLMRRAQIALSGDLSVLMMPVDMSVAVSIMCRIKWSPRHMPSTKRKSLTVQFNDRGDTRIGGNGSEAERQA